MVVEESKSHVGLLVSPGMGHLIPALELATRLSLHHNLQPTLYVVATPSSAAESRLLRHASAAHSLNIVPFPPPDLSHLRPSASLLEKIKAMMSASFSRLRSALSAASPRPAALIVDLFGTEALGMARQLGMLAYVFITSNAWFLSHALFFPAMDRPMIDDHVYNRQPLLIPGCRPLRFKDTTGVFENFHEGVYEDFGRFAREVGSADGILANTWQDLEPATLKALSEAGALTDGKVNQVPVYPIGPLTRRSDPGVESEVLEWLDRQPDESVVYVSFGSGGTLSADQITELAWGLEMSQQRFVWVVRPPAGADSAGCFFTAGTREDGSPEYLPEGFLARTKEVGLVVETWAPQAEILSHVSVGGFVTHCGWNSSLESIVNGVPTVAWPLYAEQKMNAAVLTEELGVGVRVEVVARGEIQRMVRKIMDKEEGNEIRERVKKLKNSAQKAISKGGSSYNSLSQVAGECHIFSGERDNLTSL